jgi:protein SCO1/2
MKAQGKSEKEKVKERRAELKAVKMRPGRAVWNWTNIKFRRLSFCLFTFTFCLLLVVSASAQMRDYNGTSPLYSPRGGAGTGPNGLPTALQNVGIDQKLNGQIPLDAVFLDETGRSVRLSEYFGKKPVILSLVFYECPMLCNQVLNGLVGSLKAQSFNVGEEFDVLTVSFDPREGPALASAKKLSYMQRYQRAGAEKGWHFLTGDQKSIDALTRAVGFRYSYDAETNQFAHASGIMVLTPEGKLARYFYGIEYAPKDLRLALVESSESKIGSPVDQLLLYCYHYDPVTGKYGPTIINIIRIGGLLTMLGVAALIFFLPRRRNAAGSNESMGGGVA